MVVILYEDGTAGSAQKIASDLLAISLQDVGFGEGALRLSVPSLPRAARRRWVSLAFGWDTQMVQYADQICRPNTVRYVPHAL